MKKQTKLIFLVVWFIVCTSVYFAAVRRQFEPVVPIYAVMSIVFGVMFFLVNGGIRPIVKPEGQSVHEPALTPKQKARSKYRPYVESVAVPSDRPNIFRLTPAKQKFFAELLLILFLAPTFILVLDYVLIAFIPAYK